ncbi:hypothetical protein R3W88_026725 [Solanum pinnatisectum]|uniref:Uncharacterized protein n=1 Tax=Solanum pinnatisectum TaxID=50273 RepID=A0AAV9LEA6_9SOLN|nr:hypothetical protein R3W88_026725 [Solanum pinnatisectum]
MLIIRIFESHFMCLEEFSHVFIKQSYNSHTFLSIKRLRIFEPSSSTSVSSVKLNVTLENLAEMNAKLDAMSIFPSAMGKHVDSLKDLLLAAHFKIDNVKDVSKETGVDVARIRLRLDQIVKEAIKIATKGQAGSKAIFTSLASIFEEISCFYFAIVIWVVLLILRLCGSIVVFAELYVLSFLLMPKGENFYLMLLAYYLLLLLYYCNYLLSTAASCFL